MKTYNNNSEKLLLNDICDSVLKNINLYNNYSIKNMCSIGISFPGKVIEQKKIVSGINLNWHKIINVEDFIKNKFCNNIKVRIDNDANLTAYGEYCHIYNKKYNSICFIVVGTGIGMCYISNGNIIYGSKNMCGEIGHMIVDQTNSSNKCKCNNYGCLETYSSFNGILKLYKNTNNWDTKSICLNAKLGDEHCMKVLNISLKYLALSILNIDKIINPDFFIIGGGLSNAGNFIIKILNDNIRIINKSVLETKLKNDAGIYGAYYLLNEN